MLASIQPQRPAIMYVKLLHCMQFVIGLRHLLHRLRDDCLSRALILSHWHVNLCVILLRLADYVM